jgi:hypothetical protein
VSQRDIYVGDGVEIFIVTSSGIRTELLALKRD